MPISIPVIEMIEIGAGGGSLAWVDAMGRIQVGPESAGSEPGPACYRRGGIRPAITDADLLLGKLDADYFAGGKIRLSTDRAAAAVAAGVGEPLGLALQAAAFGICEVVDENMANAARVHAVENGREIADHVMIAFGGAAPLHAARLCEKLGIERCLVPRGAGVGSAIGFLRTPFAYEAVASQVMELSGFDAGAVNSVLTGLKDTAERFVRAGTDGEVRREVTAFMRYAGQGWEIPVVLPDRAFSAKDRAAIETAFCDAYRQFFGRAVEGPEIELVTWSVKVQAIRPAVEARQLRLTGQRVDGGEPRAVFDPDSGAECEYALQARAGLRPGDRVDGPAVIVEEETSTIVTSPFDAVIQDDGSVLLIRRGKAA